MIALVLASALLFDPATVAPVAVKPVRPAPARSLTAAPPILSSVIVTLECTARANGRVENCQVLEETHPGLGFGEAAIALMRDAEVAPGPRDVQFARTIQFTP
ncbi:TonB family protein [Brevundimonas sp. GCM10030266]|uniref:TonB family protein n=1 Tax=Brevundimonas sp. GCM10030266 TaxID=3273386 RepID=UPI0036109986